MYYEDACVIPGTQFVYGISASQPVKQGWTFWMRKGTEMQDWTGKSAYDRAFVVSTQVGTQTADHVPCFVN